MRAHAFLVSISVFLYALPVSADRFTFERSGEGFVRLDTQSGDISVCSESHGQMVCKLATDEEAFFRTEIEALQNKLEKLAARVEDLEKHASQDPNIPTDEEFERSLGFMETFLRRFFGIVREFEGNEPDAGDRT